MTFIELAKQASDDTATKARGGDLGWKARGGANLAGEAEDKVFAAKNGAIVGPFKGSEGYIITKVEGSREGHIPFEMARTGAGRGEAARRSRPSRARRRPPRRRWRRPTRTPPRR